MSRNQSTKITLRNAKPDELARVLEMLERADLPRAGVLEHLSHFLIAEDDGGPVGTVGLEVYERVGLLRSLVVEDRARGQGIGTLLVEAILGLAREKKLDEVYLLTTTADAYFPRFGFERILREQVDPRLAASEELRGACPQSAVCMKLQIPQPL